MNIPQALSESCGKVHPDKAERAICIRSGMAGKSAAELYAVLENKPDAQFDTPDTHVVSRTNDNHPKHQCRLDTFFQGSLCEKAFTEEVSQKDEVQGTCHASTGQTLGLRPLCWFKPKVH
jgi:hypothetical protein